MLALCAGLARQGQFSFLCGVARAEEVLQLARVPVQVPGDAREVVYQVRASRSVLVFASRICSRAAGAGG